MHFLLFIRQQNDMRRVFEDDQLKVACTETVFQEFTGTRWDRRVFFAKDSQSGLTDTAERPTDDLL